MNKRQIARRVNNCLMHWSYRAVVVKVNCDHVVLDVAVGKITLQTLQQLLCFLPTARTGTTIVQFKAIFAGILQRLLRRRRWCLLTSCRLEGRKTTVACLLGRQWCSLLQLFLRQPNLTKLTLLQLLHLSFTCAIVFAALAKRVDLLCKFLIVQVGRKFASAVNCTDCSAGHFIAVFIVIIIISFLFLCLQ